MNNFPSLKFNTKEKTSSFEQECVRYEITVRPSRWDVNAYEMISDGDEGDPLYDFTGYSDSMEESETLVQLVISQLQPIVRMQLDKKKNNNE